MEQFFVQKIGEGSGFLVTSGEDVRSNKIAAFTSAGDLVLWLDQHLNAGLLNRMASHKAGGTHVVPPHIVGEAPDDQILPQSIGQITEGIVRKAGGDSKPIVPDVRDDKYPVTIAVSCKPDGSDLKENLMRETIRKPLTEAHKKVLRFLQDAIAKHGNHGIPFDYAMIAKKTMHTENYVKWCIKMLGLRGDLVLDVRAKGHAPFISLPVPGKKK